MDAIRKDLATATRTRQLHRKGRRRVPYPIVALVGYTNAGKSTLFNALTGAGVLAHDMLFATLDPTVRAIRLPGGGRAALSDTVGFVSELPTMLIAAFRATLEEVIEADLILHVRDVSDESSDAQQQDVNAVLSELGIEETQRDLRLIEVWNKADLLNPDERARLAHEAARREAPALIVSAVTGEGLDELTRFIEDRVNAAHRTVETILTASEGALVHWLHEEGEVLSREEAEDGATRLVVRLDAAKAAQFESRLKESRGE
jgi:GTP-binding protein HflX